MHAYLSGLPDEQVKSAADAAFTPVEDRYYAPLDSARNVATRALVRAMPVRETTGTGLGYYATAEAGCVVLFGPFPTWEDANDVAVALDDLGSLVVTDISYLDR